MILGKIIILLIIFYGLALLQSSFLNSLFFSLGSLNLILISVIILNISEKDQKLFSLGFFSAFIGGFFLDIFSSNFFGQNTAILLGASLLIKLLLKKHVRIPFAKTA